MSTRLAVHPECDGSIFCPVTGHVQTYQRSSRSRSISHVPLTMGQRKTIRERKSAARKET